MLEYLHFTYRFVQCSTSRAIKQFLNFFPTILIYVAESTNKLLGLT